MHGDVVVRAVSRGPNPSDGRHADRRLGSNAVSFFNSVLGARTNKYGDLLDVCGDHREGAIGRPAHRRGRLATHELRLELTDGELADRRSPICSGSSWAAPSHRGSVLTGLPSGEEDALKAIAAAAATSGAVEMFHAVGVTPEAPTFADATGGRPVDRVTVVDREASPRHGRCSPPPTANKSTASASARRISRSTNSGPAGALAGRQVHDDVRLVVTTSRAIDHELGLRGWRAELDELGVEVVLDTCTYYRRNPRAFAARS